MKLCIASPLRREFMVLGLSVRTLLDVGREPVAPIPRPAAQRLRDVRQRTKVAEGEVMVPTVGQVVTIERRACTGYLDHRCELHVTKVTAKRAYVGDRWWSLDDARRVLKPQYLDYETRVIL